tara:strand:+ start:446 stop:1420 length:975 start_codon:yes stop_codon:yes gene_type:complete
MGMEESADPNVWDILWVMRFFKVEFAKLATFQKVNYMPGTSEICRKDLLHRNICKYKERYSDEDFKFWPEGFNLEEEEELEKFMDIYRARKEGVEAEHSKKGSDEEGPSGQPGDRGEGDFPLYIVKKPFSSNGRGVAFVTCLQDIHNLLEDEAFSPFSKHKPLAQRYIGNVRLIGGFKFTVRVYVALTSVDPLRAYMFHDGLLRICSKKYSVDKASFQDSTIHNDSYELNSPFSEGFVLDEDIQYEGLRVSLKTYIEFVERTEGIPEKVRETCTFIYLFLYAYISISIFLSMSIYICIYVCMRPLASLREIKLLYHPMDRFLNC